MNKLPIMQLGYFPPFLTRDYSRPEMIQELLTHDVQVLECGESHVVMLNHDGMVFVWGSGDCGRLGTGSGDDWLALNIHGYIWKSYNNWFK